MEGWTQYYWKDGPSTIGRIDPVLLEGWTQYYWKGGHSTIGMVDTVLLKGWTQYNEDLAIHVDDAHFKDQHKIMDKNELPPDKMPGIYLSGVT